MNPSEYVENSRCHHEILRFMAAWPPEFVQFVYRTFGYKTKYDWTFPKRICDIQFGWFQVLHPVLTRLLFGIIISVME
jgi:hypothetical protein